MYQPLIIGCLFLSLVGGHRIWPPQVLLPTGTGPVESTFGSWLDGRITFYGTDGFSVHRGSCGYGFLDPDASTGWDIAAPADRNLNFTGSCGKCYEVICEPKTFTDGFGATLDRTSACRFPDGETAVVVTVTDQCPCNYPANQMSNSRWCCGDINHFDLSQWAFEKLADLRWGVVAVRYREVPCDYRPGKQAVAPEPTDKTPYLFERPPNYQGDQRGNPPLYPFRNSLQWRTKWGG